MRDAGATEAALPGAQPGSCWYFGPSWQLRCSKLLGETLQELSGTGGVLATERKKVLAHIS